MSLRFSYIINDRRPTGGADVDKQITFYNENELQKNMKYKTIQQYSLHRQLLGSGRGFATERSPRCLHASKSFKTPLNHIDTIISQFCSPDRRSRIFK